MANRFEENNTLQPNWFTYNRKTDSWTKHNFSWDVKLPSMPHWFLVSIHGQLNLFLPKATLEFNYETTTWININRTISLPISDINSLKLSHELE